MRNFLMSVLIVFSILTMSGCGPRHMLEKEPCIDIRGVVPPPGKSALVVGRTTIFGGAINIENYLDKKFIGTTKGHSFFVSPVEPGFHYVTARAENFDTVLLNFEPDKTYYLQNEIRMGVFIARTKYDVVDAQHLYNDMDGKCHFYEADQSSPGDDLSDEEFKEIVEDYKKEHGDTPSNQIERHQVPGPAESK